MTRARTFAALALAASALAASSAPAHLAVRLLILSPADGARVSADVTVTVQLQATLGGADSTSFVMKLDGTLIDPDAGERQATEMPRVIRIGETVETPLRALAAGRHEVSVRYRPDIDEAPRTELVAFIVDASGGSMTPLLIGASVAALAVAVTLAGLMGTRIVRTPFGSRIGKDR